jgi:quinol monooxygenase YgiN
MFALVVRFDQLDQASARAFDALVAEALPGIRDSEPGTLIYAIHSVEEAPLSRIFYEVYTSREAHRQHESYPHTKRFLAEKEPYLAGTRVEFLDTPSGKGVPS